MADGALRFAIIGAESTGKTTLAAALAPRIAADTGLKVAWVPELLREWCDHVGRTPQPHEQASILRGQHDRIEAAASTHDVVICDTTGLMTAIYSRLLFADRSLEARAVDLQRRMTLTLLTALDLPWVADPLRDGPHVRGPVDGMLRELLMQQQLPWALVSGQGAARVESALDAMAPLLRQRTRSGRGGLFTRLDERNAQPAARTWRCENCDDPACEHRLFEPGA